MTEKTLAQMTTEVVENNKRLGWHDNPVSFPEAMAMLHSEVSEALEAWRSWGLADQTGEGNGNRPAKPLGVGSEFADIFIRLLDDAWLFGADLESNSAGRYAISDSFPENMNTLHTLIARASEDHAIGNGTRRDQFTGILIFLYQLCVEYGIDLDAEYERKAAYNQTRPFRHGGKPI